MARREAGEAQSVIARTYGVDQAAISRLRPNCMGTQKRKLGNDQEDRFASMSKNYRLIALAIVNTCLAFVCGVSFAPWVPLGHEAPGNLLALFVLLGGLTVFIMIVRGELPYE